MEAFSDAALRIMARGLIEDIISDKSELPYDEYSEAMGAIGREMMRRADERS